MSRAADLETHQLSLRQLRPLHIQRPMTLRLAIAQIDMCWTTAHNLQAMQHAAALANAQGATLCAFSELAVTGYHREIARESRPEVVAPAISALCEQAAQLQMAMAFGAPTFTGDGRILNSHLLIDADGRLVATVSKSGLTLAEATFFARGDSRPVARLGGQRCSAVICREVSDLAEISAQLPLGRVDLIFVPGALRQDPEKPRTDPPEFVRDIQRLAQATGAHAVQTNWPNALNRPEESIEGGGSVVVAPDGELLFRLLGQRSGVAVFDLGARQFDWFAQ